MDFNKLIYFSEVARLGSFTLAAQKLRISQPALSKAVRLLEEEVGVSLLTRGTKGVQLTEPGRILFADADRIFRTVGSLKIRLSAKTATYAGPVLLGASDNFSNYLLPELWSQFSKKFPDAELTVFSGTAETIYRELLARKVEISVCFHESENPKIKCEKIGDVEFVLVRAPDLNVSSLEKATFVGSIRDDYGTPYAALKILKKMGVTPLKTIQANQQQVQKNMVLEGLGYSVLPKFMVAHELKSGDLKLIPNSIVQKTALYCGILSNKKLSNVAEMFRENLKSSLS